jgi:Ca-activated chloride channel family protein
MSWHSPEFLWLLLAVPLLSLLPLWAWRLRHRALGRFGNETMALKMIVGRSPGLRAARAVIVIGGIALGLVALARPQYGSHTRMLRKRGVDVVVALDFSKSMLARDVKPSRIERAKAELLDFISQLGGDRVGIVAFAGEPMEFPLTVDYTAAALFFRNLGPYDMPVGGTAIGRALTATKELLERSSHTGASGPRTDRARVVILLTDGEDHEGDPVAAAKELAKIGARVYVVGIGSRTGEDIPTYSDDGMWTGYLRDGEGKLVLTALTKQNEEQLKQIAEATGGKYFRARPGSVGMDAIRAEMRKMKQTELSARRITVREERYALVLLAAFLLIFLESLLPEAWIFKRRSEEK